MMKKTICIILLCSFLVNGCATVSTKKLERISLGMSKTEVVEKMGKPTVVKGNIRNKYGQTIEVWEYRMIPGKGVKILGHTLGVIFLLGTWAFAAPVLYREQVTPYWLYFYNDRLMQWREAGYWDAESDKIYEIDYKNLENQVK
jgi:hypothetical protein